jgi:hypothetical protein
VIAEDKIDRATAVVLYVLYEAGGLTRRLDIEEIAVEAWRKAPDLFGMRRYPEYPRLDAAYYPLKNQKARGLVSGGNRSGWMLTEAGFNLVSSRLDDFRGQVPVKSSQTVDPRGEASKEFGRIARTTAYRKFRRGRVGEVTDTELADVLRTTLTSPLEVRQERLQGLFNLSRQFGRTDIAEFLRAFGQDRRLRPVRHGGRYGRVTT